MSCWLIVITLTVYWNILLHTEQWDLQFCVLGWPLISQIPKKKTKRSKTPLSVLDLAGEAITAGVSVRGLICYMERTRPYRS